MLEALRLLWVGDARDRTIENYRPQPFPGRVTLIQARDGIAADASHSLQGWKQLAETVDIHWGPGDRRSVSVPPT